MSEERRPVYAYRCLSKDCEDNGPVELDMKDCYTRIKLVCMGCSQPLAWVPKYPQGARVWLPEFEDQPREIAVVNPQLDDDEPWRAGVYSASVKPQDRHDDGERELSEEQIESLICPEDHINGRQACKACGKTWNEP